MICELYLNKPALKSFYLFVRRIFKINLKRNELVGGGMGRISTDQLRFQGLYLSSLRLSPGFKKKKKSALLGQGQIPLAGRPDDWDSEWFLCSAHLSFKKRSIFLSLQSWGIEMPGGQQIDIGSHLSGNQDVRGFALWNSCSLEILLLIDGQRQLKACKEIRLCLKSFCAGSLHTDWTPLTRNSVSSSGKWERW